MLVAAKLDNPLQSSCSLTSKLRTPLMSLTWQRTTVAETCKLKAERVNGEAYNEHIKPTHFKKIVYRESPTTTTCYSFEYAVRKMQWATHSHNPMPRNRSPTSTLRAQLLSLTLGMGTIVAETCKLNSEACNEHIKSTHFKKKKQMGPVNRRLKPHDIHLNRCIGTHPPTCLQDEIACTPQLPTPMPLPHPPAVSTRPLPSGPDKIERRSDSRIIYFFCPLLIIWMKTTHICFSCYTSHRSTAS